MPRNNTDYEIVIQPNQSWFHIDWHGILRYRDLLFLFVKRDLVAEYKQTVLGPSWLVLKPLLTTFVFAIVFGKAVRIPTDGIPPILFYFCALIPWNYFSQSFASVSGSLLTNSHLMGKVYFPRMIIPLSMMISNFIIFLVQFAAFLGLYGYFKCFTSIGLHIQPSLFLLVLPLFFIQTVALSLGVGLWMASLTVKYRDLHNLIAFILQIWMYATPIIYPMSFLSKTWQPFFALNPMVAIVEAFRFAFFGVGYLHFHSFVISFVITLCILVSGLLRFNKVERTFIDTI